MSALIGDMRRDLFTKTLSQRVNLDSTLGSEVVSAASDQMISLWRIVRSWWRFVVTFKLESFLAAAFFALAAALVLQFGAQRFLGAFTGATRPSIPILSEPFIGCVLVNGHSVSSRWRLSGDDIFLPQLLQCVEDGYCIAFPIAFHRIGAGVLHSPAGRGLHQFRYAAMAAGAGGPAPGASSGLAGDSHRTYQRT